MPRRGLAFDGVMRRSSAVAATVQLRPWFCLMMKSAQSRMPGVATKRSRLGVATRWRLRFGTSRAVGFGMLLRLVSAASLLDSRRDNKLEA